MARPTKEYTLAKIHQDALSEFDEIQSVVGPEREQCFEDREFYSIAGAQYKGALAEQFKNKPMIEFNYAHLSVIRIFNEYRNNRITVDFVSKDGTENDKLADTCDGLYRADEQDSVANEAYDNAFEEGVGGGFGAWRLVAEYEDDEDEENERQRIRIKPIYDADSCVFFDLNSKRQDKSDAKRCFVLSSMTTNAYINEWGDDPASWPKEIATSAQFKWATLDTVYIAEYYKKEDVGETIVTFQLIDGSEVKHTKEELEDDEEALLQTLTSIGAKEIKRRKIKRERIHKYIMSGGKVLEDCGFIAGKHIPIVPFFGKRWFVGGVERCMGHVRLIKDPSRLNNMQMSKLAELAASSTIEKPIFTVEQLKGLQDRWAEDPVTNYPYMLVNAIDDGSGNIVPTGPLGYTKSPSVPPAMAALIQLSKQGMDEILGNSQQADKMVSNISAKAVELIQTRLDMQTYIYMSNMAKAMARGGEIWLSMAQEVYGSDEDRKMKIIGSSGEVSTIQMMRPVINEKTGEIEYENDLSDAEFQVVADVGPSSQSRRDATARGLTGLMAVTEDPEMKNILASMILMNMEGEGLSDVQEHVRKRLVGTGVLKPTDKDLEEMAKAAEGRHPDPQAILMESMAQNEQAKAYKAKADTIKALADAENTRADTANILSSMDIESQKHALSVVKEMQNALSGNQQTALPAENEGNTYV